MSYWNYDNQREKAWTEMIRYFDISPSGARKMRLSLEKINKKTDEVIKDFTIFREKALSEGQYNEEKIRAIFKVQRSPEERTSHILNLGYGENGKAFLDFLNNFNINYDKPKAMTNYPYLCSTVERAASNIEHRLRRLFKNNGYSICFTDKTVALRYDVEFERPYIRKKLIIQK